MLPWLRNESRQKPLFPVIHEDGMELLNTSGAQAVMDIAIHNGETFCPHVEKLFEICRIKR
ncbi:MAG: hypothetical protein E3K40_03475 [Candidatus Brocadia sp.]|nr:hypothetical protein [Candidatus Brocadia sp.]